MATLKEDIKESSKWLVKAFAADGLKLDHTIESFIEIDIFLNKHTRNGKAKAGGRLSENMGSILFSLGAYVGETIIKTVPGAKWITDDEDPEGEVNITVEFPDGMLMFPTQRIIKRVQNGQEDSIYVYGFEATKEFSKVAFRSDFWELMKPKPWWKFW